MNTEYLKNKQANGVSQAIENLIVTLDDRNYWVFTDLTDGSVAARDKNYWAGLEIACANTGTGSPIEIPYVVVSVVGKCIDGRDYYVLKCGQLCEEPKNGTAHITTSLDSFGIWDTLEEAMNIANNHLTMVSRIVRAGSTLVFGPPISHRHIQADQDDSEET
jgi:hypothetical protein